ncbi:hypothetical protein DEJ06_00520 [Curtobacterium sp. MCLR17_051]|nr:hypothetical protein DEJ09_07900 [Curtobacterium sp. MCLR17_055]PZF42611.1 hypothetical protein DEJ07_05675 [Curtobacterium sp. MCLR17_053]PZF54281.1 hypothetical protein DEJ06_00520 [Curtobacterium sp. MCLR17_051]
MTQIASTAMPIADRYRARDLLEACTSKLVRLAGRGRTRHARNTTAVVVLSVLPGLTIALYSLFEALS